MEPKRALSAGELPFRVWLRRRRATAVTLSIFSAAACLAIGLAILAATFFFTYAVVWFGYNYGVSAASELIFGRRQHISHNAVLIICWCFLVLLFVENARVKRDYWACYSLSRIPWLSPWLAGLFASPAALLVNAKASARMITDLLLVGPRLMGACVRALHRTLLLVRADLQTCSNALTILARRTSPMSAADLSAELRGRNSRGVLFDLAALGTVLFVRREPPTAVLDPDLRDQLRSLLEGAPMPELEQDAEPQPVTIPPTDRSLYELLGLSPTASLEEVRAAYRKKMKECHPDVFVGRSEEARRIAEERTKEIIAAYEALLTRYRPKQEEKHTA